MTHRPAPARLDSSRGSSALGRTRSFPEPTRTPRLLLRSAGAPASSVDGARSPRTGNVTTTEKDTMQQHEYPIFLQPSRPSDTDTTADPEAAPRSHGPYDYSDLFSART